MAVNMAESSDSSSFSDRESNASNDSWSDDGSDNFLEVADNVLFAFEPVADCTLSSEEDEGDSEEEDPGQRMADTSW